MAADLLPHNATPLERAMERVTAARLADVDPDALRRLKQPWVSPMETLPHLAFGRSVDLWHDGMSEARRRSVVARSLPMHGRKGTKAGLCEYIDIAGGELVRAITPPEGIYLDEGPTAAQRQAWLGRFAQVRLRRTAESVVEPENNVLGGSVDAGCFLGGYDALADIDDEGTFAALFEPAPSYEAVLWDNGTEELLTRRVMRQQEGSSTAVTEAYYRESIDNDLMLGEACMDEVAGAEVAFLDAPSPVIHFLHRAEATTSFPTFRYSGVDRRGSFRFVNSAPDEVREITVQDELFLGDAALSGDHLAPSTARLARYQRWHVYDEVRSGPLDLVEGSFLNSEDRFSLPAYNALIDVQALDGFGLDAAFLDDVIVGDGWLDEPTLELRERVLDASSAAKALRDKYLVSTARHRPVAWADGFEWGFFWDTLVKD